MECINASFQLIINIDSLIMNAQRINSIFSKIKLEKCDHNIKIKTPNMKQNTPIFIMRFCTLVVWPRSKFKLDTIVKCFIQ